MVIQDHCTIVTIKCCLVPICACGDDIMTTNESHLPKFIQRKLLGFWTGALGRARVTQSGEKPL